MQFSCQANHSWISVTSNIHYMEIWLVILFLSRKNAHVGQMFMLSSSMKLVPGSGFIGRNARSALSLERAGRGPCMMKTPSWTAWRRARCQVSSCRAVSETTDQVSEEFIWLWPCWPHYEGATNAAPRFGVDRRRYHSPQVPGPTSITATCL